MRVFVTGATGFVGGHLVAALLARGHQVAGSGHHVEGAAGERDAGSAAGVELHTLDLGDRAALAAAIGGFGPERVIHLAGLAHVGSSWGQMAETFRVNVAGTGAVLDAAGEVPVLLASSAEVYGAVPEAEQPIGEEREPAPASPYALTKAAAELLVLRSGGLVARPFNMIGPGQAGTFALPAFARQLAAIAAGRQEPVLAVGNLEARRDFIHVADGAAALALLAERGAPGGVYNIASGESRSIREVLDELLAASGVAVEIACDERFLRPADIPLLCGTSEPLRALGWRPERGRLAAIAELWRECRERAETGTGRSPRHRAHR
jgi:GDP-4-dehydro-6-deoxy-D-mannose reductase